MNKILMCGPVAVYFMLCAGCSKPDQSAPAAAAPEVKVSLVEQKDVPVYTEVVATIAQAVVLGLIILGATAIVGAGIKDLFEGDAK